MRKILIKIWRERKEKINIENNQNNEGKKSSYQENEMRTELEEDKKIEVGEKDLKKN